MSILIKIGLGIGAVRLVSGSVVVSIAALFQSKDYDGDCRMSEKCKIDQRTI